MCRPSCCPGETGGSGLGTVLEILAALAGLALVSAVVRALAQTAEVIAQIALISAAALLGLALAVLVTVVIIRTRSARRTTPMPLPGRLAVRSTARVVDRPAPTWARAAITTRIRTLSPPEQADTAEVERWWP
jgi:hypothetical protein